MLVNRVPYPKKMFLKKTKGVKQTLFLTLNMVGFNTRQSVTITLVMLKLKFTSSLNN